MPSLELYKKRFGGNANTNCGVSTLRESQRIVEETWYDDPYARIGYLYDWYHDDNTKQLDNIDPLNNTSKVPIELKYIVSSSQTYAKDQITYHIQLRPSQTCNVDYYDEMFADRYDAKFPIGLYIDIEDANGIYNRWLVVDKANYNDPEFPTFEILRCDKVIQYIHNGIKYNVPGVLRSQNSYNSGIWADNTSTITEDQQKFIVPMNRETEHIFYNMRMIVDNKVLTEPRTWKVSKVNRISPNGVSMVTLAQTFFDPNKDYIDEDGMWADYYSEAVIRQYEDKPSDNYAIITHAGKSDIKIGGSYKTFTVKFYNGETEIDPVNGQWTCYINDVVTNDVEIKVTANQCKVKFTGDLSYIGKNLKIGFVSDNGISAYDEVDIRRL